MAYTERNRVIETHLRHNFGCAIVGGRSFQKRAGRNSEVQLDRYRAPCGPGRGGEEKGSADCIFEADWVALACKKSEVDRNKFFWLFDFGGSGGGHTRNFIVWSACPDEIVVAQKPTVGPNLTSP